MTKYKVEVNNACDNLLRKTLHNLYTSGNNKQTIALFVVFINFNYVNH